MVESILVYIKLDGARCPQFCLRYFYNVLQKNKSSVYVVDYLIILQSGSTISEASVDDWISSSDE